MTEAEAEADRPIMKRNDFIAFFRFLNSIFKN